MRNRPAKLPNQLKSSLTKQMKKVNINQQRTPESRWIMNRFRKFLRSNRIAKFSCDRFL
jgi:hypothetical protein